MALPTYEGGEVGSVQFSVGRIRSVETYDDTGNNSEMAAVEVGAAGPAA